MSRNEKSSEDSSKITIADVAAALGISKTTVSRAISGKGRIGEDTRNRVISFIEEHGYKPNPLAKGLAQQKTYNIGWVMPGDSSFNDLPFFQSCLRGVCAEAAKNDYDVLLSFVYDNDSSSLKRMVTGNKVDGVILGRTLVDDENVKYLKESKMPFIVIGSTDIPDVMQIDNDHVNACCELTLALIANEISSFVLIGGSDKHVVNNSRREGFEAGIKESIYPVESSKIYMNSDNEEAISKIVDDVISHQTQCIVCMDDKICNLVNNKLRNDKIAVPETVKVASFYDSELLKNAQPSITAIHYSPRQLGISACKTLIDSLNGEEVSMKTLMDYEIIMKQSS